MTEPNLDSVKTLDEISTIVCKETEKFLNSNELECTANLVADKLFVSRSLSSLYLNKLYKNRKLIKIISRPVFYLDKELLERKLRVRFNKNTFEDVDEFNSFINDNKESIGEFSEMIGFNGSLSDSVKHCVMAIRYPNKGLPIFMKGSKGVGKRTLAKHVFNFSKKNHIFKNNACFKEIDAKNALELNDFLHYLLSSDNVSSEGLLYIFNGESLSNNDFNKIDDYYKKDSFEKKWRIIISSHMDLIYDFTNTISINVKLPDLYERPYHEIKELIKVHFEKESQKLNLEIFISKRCLNTVCNYQFQENVKELIKMMRIACANALMHRINGNKIFIKRIDLPEYVVDEFDDDRIKYGEENSFISIADIVDQSENNRVKTHHLRLIEEYQKYMDKTCDLDEMITNIFEEGNQYFDYLIYSKEYQSEKFKMLDTISKRIMDNITEKYNIYLSANFSIILSRMIYTEYYCTSYIAVQDDISNLVNLFKNQYPNEMKIADDIVHSVYKYSDVMIDNSQSISLACYIHQQNQNIVINNISGIIISHGYSTASSIADAANRLLNKNVFEAIDMPLNVSVDKIVELIKKYISYHTVATNLIFLVDMGSLENIGYLLNDIPNMNIGIINNISTKVALSVGLKIVEGKSVETILIESCKEAVTSYTYIENKVKQKAILFSLENGEVATKRLIDLFKRSLPGDVKLSLITYDFNYDFSFNDRELFSKYDVLLIIGSINRYKEKNIPFIALEDLITFESIDVLKGSLKSVLVSEEIDQFSKNLLSNFSLENIIEYLTILNPQILLSMVEEALNNLQCALDLTFNERTIIGLNVHICCLIERLVTKENIDFSNLDVEEDEKYFELFKKCFSNIERHYRIEVPLNEYRYIKRYIYEYLQREK